MSMQAAPDTPPPINTVVIGMGDEGVPIRVIARTTKLPAEDIRAILHEAIDAGTIIQMPREDWHAKTNRETRDPGLDTFETMTDEALHQHVARVFGTTRLQSAFLLPLIKRKEVSRGYLHSIVQGLREVGKKETSTKMSDVVICHLRKRLKKHGVVINTIWGSGYYITPEQRKIMRDLIVAHVSVGNP